MPETLASYPSKRFKLDTWVRPEGGLRFKLTTITKWELITMTETIVTDDLAIVQDKLNNSKEVR